MLSGVSPTVVVILVVLIVVQVAAQVYGLVDLTRRDAVRGGSKWVWVLVIAMGNLPGAIAYLVAGRVSATVDSTASRPSSERGEAARRAVDELYGPRDRS